ncbi:MAG: NAD(P)-binding domain-containing protein [candidate division Zixibacteria bacterium]|nr:NAD(P)-binding domain-containing protein [candidate division Zixibacteria bacterium]
MTTKKYDLIIIGAGPIGLESALYAAECGLNFLILEREQPSASLNKWGFVRMFSSMAMNVSPLGARILNIDANGSYPTGREMKESYYDRLVALEQISSRLISGFNVKKVSRSGLLKAAHTGDNRRAEYPFKIFGTDANGWETYYEAKAVIDASGVYSNPNSLGPGGLPAIGEQTHADKISYHLRDLRRDYTRLGKTFCVVGAGHSACTMIAQFDQLTRIDNEVNVVWVTTTSHKPPAVSVPDDPLVERARVVNLANEISCGSNPRIKHLAGYWVEEIRDRSTGPLMEMTLTGGDGERGTFNADFIFALVGYRPDREIYEELQVHECFASSGPMKLAARLSEPSAGTDCLDPVEPDDDLYINPEPDFYILGSKSYGRMTNFLIRNGYDQIRSVFRRIVKDKNLDLYNRS